ncbi:hypothetical protein ACLPJF_23500, partial [Pseudomonas vlassakiae]|uniref:hypothetical protein n=1 Tax=Pseudomonas vlassakiae TaxID=485888 RepID=UPI003FD88768
AAPAIYAIAENLGLLRSPFATQGRSYKKRASCLVRWFAAKVLLPFSPSLPFAQQCLSPMTLFPQHFKD